MRLRLNRFQTALKQKPWQLSVITYILSLRIHTRESSPKQRHLVALLVFAVMEGKTTLADLPPELA